MDCRLIISSSNKRQLKQIAAIVLHATGVDYSGIDAFGTAASRAMPSQGGNGTRVQTVQTALGAHRTHICTGYDGLHVTRRRDGCGAAGRMRTYRAC